MAQTPPRNITANRRQQNWSRSDMLRRVLWEGGGALLFRVIPRPFWGARRALLKAFGAKIGAQVHLHPTVRILIPFTLEIGDQTAVGDRAILYGLGPITIGERVTISQGAHLCAGTHDWRDPAMPLIKAPITVGPDAWICAEAFVGPGVTVGQGAIVGARAVAVKDVPTDHMALGNPAQFRAKDDQ